jgi:hypothetical protein
MLSVSESVSHWNGSYPMKTGLGQFAGVPGSPSRILDPVASMRFYYFWLTTLHEIQRNTHNKFSNFDSWEREMPLPCKFAIISILCKLYSYIILYI